MGKIEISRGTKAFSAFHGKDLNGAYPAGFLAWLKTQGWLYGDRCHLCAGQVDDPGSFRVDIRPEMEPDLIADARKTGMEDEKFDSIAIDPPYSKELAQRLYKTGEHYASINEFVKEGMRLVRWGGLVITLSYEIPKKPKSADLVAVWGIYTIPHRSFMRCLAVFRKVPPTVTL